MYKFFTIVLLLINLPGDLLSFGLTFEEDVLPSNEAKELYGPNFNSVNIVDEQEDINITADVKFFFYTRKNPLEYDQILLDNLYYLQWTHFDPKRPVKILIHGWKCSYRSAYNILLKNAYLIQYNANVVVVDWNKFSKLSYFTSKQYVNNIAQVVAEFVDNLCETFAINPDDIHMVGHSLGAHIAGIAGLKIQRKIGRITGLDPAGPGYSIEDEQRISTKSANFVDIIHTAGRMTGFYHNLGHVDFYPNGGTPIQPGCGLDFTSLKSHRRAYWLFSESITNPEGFSAVPCNSWSDYKYDKCQKGNQTIMGEHVSLSARGKYFLRTNSQSPFAMEKLKKKINSK